MYVEVRHTPHLVTDFIPISDEENKFSIYRDFLANIRYQKPNLSSTNEALEAAMRDEMYTRKMECPQLKRTLHLAASLIEVCDITASNFIIFYPSLFAACFLRMHPGGEKGDGSHQLVSESPRIPSRPVFNSLL
jgi:hypothetical protein